MTTYREAIYMCLDLLKGMSDDYTYTEEHIAFLLDKFRALVLKQRYGADPRACASSNYQTMNVPLEKGNDDYLHSTIEIPYMLQIGTTRVVTDDYYNTTFEFTSRERMPFVRINKYLNKISYAAIDNKQGLTVKTTMELDEIKLVAVFENPREVAGSNYMECAFPVEESLVTAIIEMVVKELHNSASIPADDINNARDDKGSLSTYGNNTPKSAE